MPSFESYPCVIPNWDNTPRSGTNGTVFKNATPSLFQEQLKRAVKRVSVLPENKKFIFVKAWNEWAEGNYLEPDLQYGTQFLEVIQQEIKK